MLMVVGIIVLTLAWLIWLYGEARQRMDISWEAGSGPLSNLDFGWKFHLVLLVGAPALAVLWTFVT